jgi:hypothetical protein
MTATSTARRAGIQIMAAVPTFLVPDVAGTARWYLEQPAPGRLLADLQKGRSYVLICNLRDTLEKPPHAQLGMAATLHVK